MLNNFQGQPLTPINRAYDRATSGFAVLLNSIQGVANRVVENQKIAEQRDWTEKRDRQLYDREIEKITFSQQLQDKSNAIEGEKRFKQQVALAGIQSDIRQQEKVFDFRLENSPEAIQSKFEGARASAAGTFAGQAGQRAIDAQVRASTAQNEFNRVLAGYTEKYPEFAKYNMLGGVTEDGQQFVQVYDPVSNQWENRNMSWLTQEVGKAADIKNLFTSWENEAKTGGYDPNAWAEYRTIVTNYQKGNYNNKADLISALERIPVSPVDLTQLASDKTNALKAAGLTMQQLSALTRPNVSGGIATPEWFKPFMSTSNRIPFTEANKNDFISIVTGPGEEGTKKAAIIAKLNREYASVADIRTTLSKVDIEKYPEADAFLKQLDTVMTIGGTNMPSGGQIYLNPFRNTSDPFLIGSTKQLADDIYNSLFQNSTPTTQQTVDPSQKRKFEIQSFLQ
jgi:hypothetical protein